MEGRSLLSVKTLAAVDLYGRSGTSHRRRLITWEFVLGTVGSAALGILSLGRGQGWTIVLGLWLIGISANYLPLALYARTLSKGDRLDVEVAGLDLSAEIRRYSVMQIWLLVPFVVGTKAAIELRSA